MGNCMNFWLSTPQLIVKHVAGGFKVNLAGDCLLPEFLSITPQEVNFAYYIVFFVGRPKNRAKGDVPCVRISYLPFN